MTGPGTPAQLPDDGKPVAVPADGSAVLVTEYCPAGALVINNGTVPVWIGSDSGVSPSNGVPVPAGTAVPIQKAGFLYVVSDPASTVAGAIVLAGLVSAWDSPATIAAEVAAELLATGIPSVLVEDILYDSGPLGLAAGAQQTLDIHGYESLIISASHATAGHPILLECDFEYVAGGAPLYTEYLYRNVTAADLKSTWTIPAKSQVLVITNNDTTPVIVTVIGSNRPAAQLRQEGYSTLPRDLLVSNGAAAAGAQYLLAATDSGSDFTRFNRTIAASIVATILGILWIEYVRPSGVIVLTPVYSYTGPALQHNVIQLAHPLVPVRWYYSPNTAGNLTAELTIGGLSD